MDVDALLDRRRLKRRLLLWRLAAVVAVLALIAVAVQRTLMPGVDHVARLSIDGFIAEDPERERAIDALLEDDYAKAVIVRINSPGGTTTGSEEIFKSLRRIGERKPVVAVIGTMGTSGGYIVAIAADRIFARETSLTGSIGVLFQTAEFTELLDKIGVATESLKSSPLKGQPTPLEPMSEEVRTAMKALLEDSFVWFRGLVRERRGLEDVRLDRAADGRVFTGRQAIELGLIDEFGGEREARRWLAAEHEIGDDLPAKDVTWGREDEFGPLSAMALARKILTNERLTLDGLLSVWQPQLN